MKAKLMGVAATLLAMFGVTAAAAAQATAAGGCCPLCPFCR